MSSCQLFFIYDTHCPWSYAATPLVDAIIQAFPEMELNLLHCAYYDGSANIGVKTTEQVEEVSGITLADAYHQQRKIAADSTISANLMAWVDHKLEEQSFEILKALQALHFQQGLSLNSAEDFDSLIKDFKLSAPNKVFSSDKLSKDAEAIFADIGELQEVIGTQSIPALLLAVDEELVLLNHNYYLKDPQAIVEAIKLELN
ncbi:hypothetical protein HR060_09965 [Catenovulum sp. SM1970]|nr:hypothetical protein [Marinifaba aquimaris]